ncbi:MAG: hypothetical protein DMG96_22230 [Acidobacteria bacterium]|nr:MAG: hypothetical protein DMG98_22700 [Acidobacteriota bacterium]PYV73728.1 MAG: hypothetical protein DMG96_22230 [Acidobacteriota bacterium]
MLIVPANQKVNLMPHKKRYKANRRKNVRAPRPKSTAILIGNAVTTSAEMPTRVNPGVLYSGKIWGIGPSGNVSERNAEAL